ncbi:MAG: HAD hydrolase-like protein [Candidatus Woesearchaeota archaeon]
MKDTYEELKTLKELYDNYIPIDNDNFRLDPLDRIYKYSKEGQLIPEIKLNDRFRFHNLIFDLDDTLYEKTEQLGDDYSIEDVDKITIPQEEFDYLKELSEKNNMYIVSMGDEVLQRRKIEVLGLEDIFVKENIHIVSKQEDKKEKFEEIINETKGIKTYVIGDRIDSEIHYGNELGLDTIRILRGKYSNMIPEYESQEPNYEIFDLINLETILYNNKFFDGEDLT